MISPALTMYCWSVWGCYPTLYMRPGKVKSLFSYDLVLAPGSDILTQMLAYNRQKGPRTDQLEVVGYDVTLLNHAGAPLTSVLRVE